MQGTLPDACDWILHTSLTWLAKCTQQEADDEEETRWIQIWQEEETRQTGGESMAARMRRNTHRTPQHTTDNHSATQRPLLPTQLDHDTDSDSDFEATEPPENGYAKVITRRIIDSDK